MLTLKDIRLKLLSHTFRRLEYFSRVFILMLRIEIQLQHQLALTLKEKELLHLDAAHSRGSKLRHLVLSHAEGYQTQSIGSYSRISRGSVATGAASSALYNLIADQQHSTVVGQYNESDREGTLFVVGSGESEATRANAFEVSADGAIVDYDMDVSGVLSINGDNVPN